MNEPIGSMGWLGGHDVMRARLGIQPGHLGYTKAMFPITGALGYIFFQTRGAKPSTVNTISQSNCVDIAKVVDSALHKSSVSALVMETQFPPKNDTRAYINIITGETLMLLWKNPY